MFPTPVRLRDGACDPESRPPLPRGAVRAWPGSQQSRPQESHNPALRVRNTENSEGATLGGLAGCAPTSAEARQRRGGDGAQLRRAARPGGRAGGPKSFGGGLPASP